MSVSSGEDATDFLKADRYTETIFTEGGKPMTVYLDLLILLNFLVDWLLLMGANRLAGHPPGWKRCAAAAAVGALYAGACVLPGLHFLGNLLWRLVSLGAMALIAFGYDLSALRRGAVFVLLSMAMGGMAMGLGKGNVLSLCLAAGGVALLCGWGIRFPVGMERFHRVELQWKGQSIRLTALVDTGNTLRDPVTGSSVLVVGPDVAAKLGISREMICDPITALTKHTLPGGRLIPYRAVGKPGGMLLMLRFDRVVLGDKQISPMVAFAPEEIGKNCGYQALAGGVL